MSVGIVWCSHPGCLGHFHVSGETESRLTFGLQDGWVYGRDDRQPVAPVKAGERTPRLIPFCPEHADAAATSGERP